MTAGAGFAINLGGVLGLASGQAAQLVLASPGAALAAVLVYALGSAAPLRLVLTGVALSSVLGGGPAYLATGSIAGGLLAAAAVYALSLGSGLGGLRLVVVGIAVNAMLTALNSWIVLRADMEAALAATGWSAGSLNGLDWHEVLLPFAVIAALTLLLAALAPAMHQTALGDDQALASGVRLSRLRLLLLAADLAAQLLLAPVALPVGVVTTVIGGCYLAALLARRGNRHGG
ncbi:iron complex transport system permease protein [Nonomuraea rubra]|uniref:Iron complex transport system permease protein n=1 Tax=Nonomuraea rubra TaxID=46180 RepID=A0A7X0NS47_9ACTN|nr:iron complex transport system permease protein [Nonomuraea rubra]